MSTLVSFEDLRRVFEHRSGIADAWPQGCRFSCGSGRVRYAGREVRAWLDHPVEAHPGITEEEATV